MAVPAMADTPPAELNLSALGRGDRQALEALYLTYRGPVSRFCLRRLQDPEVAAEVVQEVFIGAFQGVSRFEGRSSLLTWLLGIAWNLCRKHYRERGRHHPLLHAEALPSPGPGPYRRAEEGDELERVRRALRELPEKQQELLSLRVDGELSYQEIAEVTGYGLSDVKVTIHRARSALKLALRLRQEGFDGER